jgi:N-acetylglutamate synthase-like GNAT family acetyltransferase
MPGAYPIILRAGVPDDFAAMAQISADARSRYRTMAGLGYIADTPPVAEHRFHEGRSIVAVTPARTIAGFVLTRPLDGLLLLDNISTSSEFQGQRLGNRLLRAVLNQATAEGHPAVTLTTFREPRWNGPWFRKFGFLSMPDDSIGPELRALIEYQSGYLDARTRETLWRQFHRS